MNVRLLDPYLQIPLTPGQEMKLRLYLELLIKWNARTNLTAIRDEDGIVRRHFGESLFLAEKVPPFKTALDFGSGGGFPGIPLQIVHPQLEVTLAESQGKKASFLREAVRTLDLPTAVWAKRVEEMPAARKFDLVTMRAVDDMESALSVASARVAKGGTLAVMCGTETPELPEDFHWQAPIPIPGSTGRILLGMFHVEHSAV